MPDFDAADDEVGGAIQDGVDGLDGIARQRGKSFDDGGGAADGRAEEDFHTGFAGEVLEFRAAFGDDGLVGGDDVAAVAEHRRR